ncbi:hypothetical protein MRB53_004226 [Persea americana]|uniref:Uncharacterized protein n=1 Tax=Persea americana TaxID=3435 RepID=A0ACC2MAM5_PERAE|nr:hypothetical protein MRB53_004226 [Persea americana]
MAVPPRNGNHPPLVLLQEDWTAMPPPLRNHPLNNCQHAPQPAPGVDLAAVFVFVQTPLTVGGRRTRMHTSGTRCSAPIFLLCLRNAAASLLFSLSVLPPSSAPPRAALSSTTVSAPRSDVEPGRPSPSSCTQHTLRYPLRYPPCLLFLALLFFLLSFLFFLSHLSLSPLFFSFFSPPCHRCSIAPTPWITAPTFSSPSPVLLLYPGAAGGGQER